MESIDYLWKDRKRFLGMPLSFTRYRLSEDRLFCETGFLNVKSDEVLLYRVRDLRLTMSLGQRIFGVGTVLWPWIAVSALGGNLWQTVGLAAIYGLSALTRELMEAHYMGEKIGLNALENLISMYVGMQLFGLLGLFFGPMGYLLVKETGKGGKEH